MKIVLLTNNSLAAKALAAQMHKSQLSLQTIVIEEKIVVQAKKKRNTVRQLLQKVISALEIMLNPTGTRTLKRLEAKLQFRANALLDQFIQDQDITDWPPDVPIIKSTSINNEIIVEQLVGKQPDLIAVFGTSILKQPILSIPKMGCLNAHTSILPEYRGTRPEFWQCYHTDFSHAGITIHFIDRGVDTGDVVFQKKTAIKGKPDPFYLRALNTISLLKYYPEVIQKVLAQEVIPSKQGKSNTPVYRYKDITLDKRLELLRKLKSYQ